ncbi:protein kinase domain-containing protein [Haliangium sp.]|uniref:serine/threonine-protein kinase n=1 Tax=Haliangium sp. TaxID=2663208 RepID=UPI003D1448B9
MSKYRIGRMIGRGGMSVVYEAEKWLPDDSVCPVAIKRLLPAHDGDREFERMLVREARVCLEVTHGHPNLVTVFDIDQDGHGPFLVMERVDGHNLEEIRRAGALPASVVRRIFAELLDGLAHAHGHGIVHRDISPRNIMLSLRGDVKLSDFGLASASSGRGDEAGAGAEPCFQGTAAYASPEALRGERPGPSADLYSLAAVIYLLLTGSPPFGYGDARQIQHRMEEWRLAPLAAEVPQDLGEVVLGLLQHDPRARVVARADDALAALEEYGGEMADDEVLAAMVARTREAQSRAVADEEVGTAPTAVVSPMRELRAVSNLDGGPSPGAGLGRGAGEGRPFPPARPLWWRWLAAAVVSVGLLGAGAGVTLVSLTYGLQIAYGVIGVVPPEVPAHESVRRWEGDGEWAAMDQGRSGLHGDRAEAAQCANTTLVRVQEEDGRVGETGPEHARAAATGGGVHGDEAVEAWPRQPAVQPALDAAKAAARQGRPSTAASVTAAPGFTSAPRAIMERRSGRADDSSTSQE